VAAIERGWGTEAFVRERFSELTQDDEIMGWIATLSRYAMSPGAAAAYERMIYDDDVREILPTIHVPALILRREHDNPDENRRPRARPPRAAHGAPPWTRGSRPAALRRV
jgi:hypothetical protein